MKIITIFLIAAGFLIVGFIFRKWDQDQKRKKRERELRRKKLFDSLKSQLDKVTKAVNQFSGLLDFSNGYFTNYRLVSWLSQYQKLHDGMQDSEFKATGLTSQEVETIDTFLEYFENAKTYRDEYNHQFIQTELENYKDFFNDIEGRKLDIQQRTAIVKDEDNNIIIAGAGSGKTTTTIGKVTYVLDRYKVRPEEILLISFTNKSAKDLRDRIEIDGVEAKTFHKFGKDIIAEVEGKQPSIFDESQFRPLLTRYFNELIQDENYLKKVTTYFTDFLKPTKSEFEFDNQGDYIQYLKDKNFRSYKLIKVPVRGRTTYKMEVVKSIEECKIANFLLFNSINYEYEYPYEHDTATQTHRQYKPDFTIEQNGQKVYVEHFGVSRDDSVPPWFANDGETQEDAKNRYWEKIYWARALHEQHGTTLIETFSYEMFEDILFDNLTENLQEAGIELIPKSPKEIWGIIQNVAQDEVKNFITLVQTFITLMKSNSYSINDVLYKNNEIEDGFHKKRNKLFIEIIRPIYEKYEDHLRKRKEIDFSDMINRASDYLRNGNHNRRFSYVIIDEFQDISIGRYQLVKAIIENNPACKLFCVGDDWQSIYRFSGSDIALFKQFSDYFGFTVKSKIETTYRFHDPLLNLSSEFIQKNPNQAKKKLKGVSQSKHTNYKIVYSVSENQDDTYALKQIFDELIQVREDIHNKTIFILGRYNFDVSRIKNEGNIFQINNVDSLIQYQAKSPEHEIVQLTAQFLTVHKAKGLEADIVIILNCNSGKHGFPSELSDDTVLNLLLSEADRFENGEERRLFYVAMTRAKEYLYFVADSSYKSKFIAELEVNSNDATIRKCPRCKTTDLVRRSGTSRKGNTWAFWGCSNYLYGCDYKEWES